MNSYRRYYTSVSSWRLAIHIWLETTCNQVRDIICQFVTSSFILFSSKDLKEIVTPVLSTNNK
jgi:hypothetical protein